MRTSIGSLIALLVLAGCAAGPSTGGGSGPAGASSATTQTVAITLAHGTADPNGARIAMAKGTTLVLTVTSDHADAVHVHGYDIEIPVTAGKAVTTQIVLDQVGRFEVESHEPQLTILQLVVS